MNLSWESRMLEKLRFNMKYAVFIKQYISNLIGKVKKEKQSEESRSLITILEHIQNSYVRYEQYFKLLEIKYLNSRLKISLEKVDSKDTN